MCGLAGFYLGDKSRANLNTKYLAQKMTASLSHRGPDGSGVWFNSDNSVALGHSRLSIIDLSDAGAQPMTSMGYTPQQRRMMASGKKNATKRSVSETKKKFVAAQQNWNCAKCKKQLPAWFEVDHTIRLEHGGTNHVSNLTALCRDCHGEKTAMENL